MTTVAFRFPWGRYHATPWGAHVNEGLVEWPPSPWRILRAFVATWKERAPDLPASDVLGLLGSLSNNPTFSVPEYAEAHSRHYYPRPSHLENVKDVTEKVLDAVVVCARDAEMLVHWPVDLDSPQKAALASLCAELPYLGRIESICSARVVDSPPTPNCMPAADCEDRADAELVQLLCVDGDLDVGALVRSPGDVQGQRRTMPSGCKWVSYSRPRAVRPSMLATHRGLHPTGLVTTARWRVGGPTPPSRLAAVAVADVMRRAALQEFGGGEGRWSETLGGKADGRGHALNRNHLHSHYLVYSESGGHLIDSIVIWSPTGFTGDELTALDRIRALRGYEYLSDFRPCRLGLEGFGSIADLAPELSGPSKAWTSLTPFAPDGHLRPGRSFDQHLDARIRKHLEWRGFPAPTAVGSPHNGASAGWANFRSHRASERLRNARRATGVRIEFPVAVDGPVSLGQLAHFGLGLFAPEVLASGDNGGPMM